MFPRFNAPSRPAALPRGIARVQYDYTTAESLRRDMQLESRMFPPRQDGMKVAAPPNPFGDMGRQCMPTHNAYVSSDNHNWITVPRGGPFTASPIAEPLPKWRDQKLL